MGRVTIMEAAQRLGVSVDTVRRRIRRGELQAFQEPTAQGFVWLVDLPEAPPQPHMREEGASGEGQALRELVAALQAQVSAQQQELDARRREVQELHVLLQQAQMQALPPPRQKLPWWRRLLPWGSPASG